VAAVQDDMIETLTEKEREALSDVSEMPAFTWRAGEKAIRIIDAQAADIERLKAAAEEMRKHALSEAGHAIRAEDKWSASKQLLGWVRSLHECDESERSRRILEAIDALDQQQRPEPTAG
jgi:hypothetical protein